MNRTFYPMALNEPALTTTRIRVLLIDDEYEEDALTHEILESLPDAHFQLERVTDYQSALTALEQPHFDVLLLDDAFCTHTGLDLLREIGLNSRAWPVILLTNQGPCAIHQQLFAAESGVDDYLDKATLTLATLERTILFAIVKFREKAGLEQKVRERTQELATAQAALLEADRRKNVFLATLSHELRNPLAPIRNSLEIIRLAQDNSEVVKQQRERMERQVNQLVRLVEDLVDISRMTTDQLRLQPETIVLQELLEQTLDVFRAPIAQAQLHLVTVIPSNPITIHGDRVRLIQVIGNLLNNAIKFSTAGGTITVAVVVDLQIHISVTDTGIGIPADILPEVFSLFASYEPQLYRSQSGLGIGLALARRIVEMHDGTITAQSSGGGTGANFTIHLPHLNGDALVN